MFDDGLMKAWFVTFAFVSTAGALLGIRTWFRLRALEKSEQAKTLDLYDQIDKLKIKIDSMFN